MSKNPSEDILESLYTLRIRESAQLKTVLELFDMEIHQKISTPHYQKLKTMVNRSIDQKLGLRNFGARMRELKQEQWSRIAGVNVVFKEDKEKAISGKQKDSVREETSVVCGAIGGDIESYNWVAYFRTQSRRNLYRFFYGRAPKSWD